MHYAYHTAIWPSLYSDVNIICLPMYEIRCAECINVTRACSHRHYNWFWDCKRVSNCTFKSTKSSPILSTIIAVVVTLLFLSFYFTNANSRRKKYFFCGRIPFYFVIKIYFQLHTINVSIHNIKYYVYFKKLLRLILKFKFFTNNALKNLCKFRWVLKINNLW